MGAFSFLEQAWREVQALPGIAMADLTADGADLQTKLDDLLAKQQEINDMLHGIDDVAGPLHEMNKKALSTLDGLWEGSEKHQLLDQIPRVP